VSGIVARRWFRRVPLPTPDGPQMTRGRGGVTVVDIEEKERGEGSGPVPKQRG